MGDRLSTLRAWNTDGPSIFIGPVDVQLALDAGFSKDEIAFMLDLAEPEPDAKVDGEDETPAVAAAIRVVK